MDKVLGILVLIAGVVFPMVMVGWLAIRMGRQPRPSARLVGLVLAFNFVLPLGLILFGLGMLAPQFWTVTVVRVGAYSALLAAAVILVLLVTGPRAGAPTGGRDGG